MEGFLESNLRHWYSALQCTLSVNGTLIQQQRALSACTYIEIVELLYDVHTGADLIEALETGKLPPRLIEKGLIMGVFNANPDCLAAIERCYRNANNGLRTYGTMTVA